MTQANWSARATRQHVWPGVSNRLSDTLNPSSESTTQRAHGTVSSTFGPRPFGRARREMALPKVLSGPGAGSRVRVGCLSVLLSGAVPSGQAGELRAHSLVCAFTNRPPG